MRSYLNTSFFNFIPQKSENCTGKEWMYHTLTFVIRVGGGELEPLDQRQDTYLERDVPRLTSFLSGPFVIPLTFLIQF